MSIPRLTRSSAGRRITCTPFTVSPVGELRSPHGETAAPASTELTMRIRDALVGMQFGRTEDTFGWMHQVC